MRAALRKQRVRTASIPAPVGGLNALDPYANMAPTDAIVMDNWVPGVNVCQIRNGYTARVTGFAAAVESLLPYNSATAAKLFAAAGTAFYDATTPGAVGAAVVSGLANARWQHINFGTIGGQFLLCVNAADKMRLFDGTHWIAYGDGSAAAIASITRVGTTATLTTSTPHGLVAGQLVTVSGATPSQYNVAAFAPTITGATTFTYIMASDPGASAAPVGTLAVAFPIVTGVDTAAIKDLQVYASRVWLIEKNSFRAWYLPLNAVSGAASAIDLSSLYVLGGALAGMVTWQVAGTNALNTYVGFVSTQGEVLLYQGSDPSNAAAWGKVGQFRIGRPVGQRFYERAGTDTLLLTVDGVVPMTKAALTDRQEQSDAISFKVSQLINDDIAVYGANFGWQTILYPIGNKIIVNVPKPSATDNIQYVMNTITNKWCRYTGLAANCWGLFNDALYFGAATAVYQAEIGHNDNGAGIAAKCVPAYSYFGSKGQQKLFTAVRPIVTASAVYTPRIGLSVDFEGGPETSSPNLSAGSTGSLWNVAIWNAAPWGADQRTNRDWQWLGGAGFAATMEMSSLTKDMAVQWAATDYCFEAGGIL